MLTNTKVAFLVISCIPFITCANFGNYGSYAFYTQPTAIKQFSSIYEPPLSSEFYHESDFAQKWPDLLRIRPTGKIYKFEQSDAIVKNKYSPPAGELKMSPGLKMLSMTLPNDRVSMPVLTQNSKVLSASKPKTAYDDVPKHVFRPTRDLRFIESATDQSPKSSSTSDFKLEDASMKEVQSDMSAGEHTVNVKQRDKSNFTNIETKLLPVSSDAVLSYHIPSSSREVVASKNVSNMSPELDINVSSLGSEGSVSNQTVINSASSMPSEIITETAIILNTYQFDVFNQTDSIILTSPLSPSHHDEANFSNGMPLPNTGYAKLSSGSVAGIVVAVLVCITLVSSAVIYLVYRKLNGKCTSVVDGKFNTDNCGYLDDSLRSSIYLNNHIELPKESSEEMSSLDNDSFLNSLETMTIQNYWADNSKNTKV